MNVSPFKSQMEANHLNIDALSLETRCLEILDMHGHILFLLDRTLDESIFNEVLSKIEQRNIGYIPLALKKDMRVSNLLFIRIETKEIFNVIKDQLIQLLIKNYEIENDSYFVHGFGVGKFATELDELVDSIKKKLVIVDQGKKILFRWYDPRVLIYLPEIFKKEYVLGLLKDFKEWHFLHPKGFFSLDAVYEIPSILSLRQVNDEQSIDLDLIEIANSVFQQLNEFEQIEMAEINPLDIHRSLKYAYQEYGIQNYLDLVTYGLYSQIVHKDFIQHSIVTDVLYEHCVVGEMTFTDAMDSVSKDLYEQISKELNGYEI
ncbi:hypothetical protein F4U02_03275 [Acinetobacter haemolyticus]|uniref:hypothetical protein n=1 Tax=Acinetobacter haemolyticus TaxID=29430 RepID=UPI0012C7577C|nr:hypothetical protein [Acinetobacter haemolyticus]